MVLFFFSFSISSCFFQFFSPFSSNFFFKFRSRSLALIALALFCHHFVTVATSPQPYQSINYYARIFKMVTKPRPVVAKNTKFVCFLSRFSQNPVFSPFWLCQMYLAFCFVPDQYAKVNALVTDGYLFYL